MNPADGSNRGFRCSPPELQPVGIPLRLRVGPRRAHEPVFEKPPNDELRTVAARVYG